jgi:cell division protein FtsL
MKRFFPVWIFPILIAFAFMTVWIRLTVVKTTYELNQANRTLHNLKLEKEQLELKVAQLRSPRRLESLAKQKFNLNPPSPERIISLKDDQR